MCVLLCFLEIDVLCGTEYIIGRKNVAVLLQDDASISRKHATLLATFDSGQLVRLFALAHAVVGEDRLHHGLFWSFLENYKSAGDVDAGRSKNVGITSCIYCFVPLLEWQLKHRPNNEGSSFQVYPQFCVLIYSSHFLSS